MSSRAVVKKNKTEFTFLLVLILLLVFLLVYFFLKNKKNLSENNLSSIESDKRSKQLPTPTPRAIPHGKWGFGVGQSDQTVPQFRRGFIDPYDPAKGGTQTVTINVRHSTSVNKVSAVLKTDHTISQSYPFKLISGSNTNGQWQGSWKVEDTYLYTYALVLKAESSNKSASVEVTLR